MPNQGRKNVWQDLELRTSSPNYKEKDAIIDSLLDRLAISNPLKFNAITMPAVVGPEISILKSLGVPPRNIWAVEGNQENFDKIQLAIKDRKHPLFRVRILDQPLRSDDAIRAMQCFAEDENVKFGLIYLDYYGMPGSEHLDVLRTIFGHKMLDIEHKTTKSPLLILNFGLIQRDRNRKLGNDSLEEKQAKGDKHIPTKSYVDAELKRCGLPHPPYLKCEVLPYRGIARSEGSENRPQYVTTAFWF